MDDNIVSLSQLAIELGVNKSKLNYYAVMGLIKPITKLGRIYIFEKDKVLATMKKIEASKNKGKTIKQIIEEK